MANLKLTVYSRGEDNIYREGNGIYSTGFHNQMTPQIEGEGAIIIPWTKDRMGRAHERNAEIFSSNYFNPGARITNPIIGIYGRNDDLSSQRLEFVLCSAIPETNYSAGHALGFDDLCQLIKKGHTVFGYPGKPQEHYSS